METYRFFYKGRWRGINDKVWLNLVFSWRVMFIHDDGTVVLNRGRRFRTLNCLVRVS